MRPIRFNFTGSISYISVALAASLGWSSPGAADLDVVFPESAPAVEGTWRCAISTPAITGSVPGETAEDEAFRAKASPAGHFIHLMQPGDTLETICRIYGVDEARLRRLNRITGDRVSNGTKIAIPRA